MSKTIRVLVLRTAGTNCDEETAWAFSRAGARAERLHVGVLVRGERRLEEFDILAFPGGFSYGDDLGAATVLANQLRCRLREDLEAFVASGKPVLGICNGFQVLVRLGFLPGWPDQEKPASLIENVSAKFEDRWVDLRVESSRSPLLGSAGRAGEGGGVPRLRLPVAHREGRFVVREPEILERLRAQGQIALTYARRDGSLARGEFPANPNGSIADIAAITNPAGNVLGMMPHPERFAHALHDPRWTRDRSRLLAASGGELERGGDGTPIFDGAVRAARAERAG